MKQTALGALAALALSCSGAEDPSGVEPVANGSPQPLEKPTDAAPAGDTPPGEMATILEEHNRVRKEHCAPPLAWSNEIAKTAQAWADQLKRKGCAFEHSKSRFGENLAGGTIGTMGADRAVEIWYRERTKYDFRGGGFSMDAGHFTQVVWEASRKVGCGTVTCKDEQIWVCNYDPPGNMQGQFQQNVHPSGCKKK